MAKMVEEIYTPLKLCRHPLRVKELREGGFSHSPLNVQFDLTGRCNYKCPGCYFREGVRYDSADGARPLEDLDTAWVLEMLEEISGIGVKAVEFTGGGEPLLHKDFEVILGKALDIGLKVGIITNGRLLGRVSEVLLAQTSWIRVSFDAGTPEIYAETHGVGIDNYWRVLSNMEDLVDLGDSYISSSYVVFPTSAQRDEMETYVSVMRNLGIMKVRFSAAISKEGKDYLSADVRDEVLETLRDLDGGYSEKDFKIVDLFTPRYRNSIIGLHKFVRCLYSNYIGVVGCDYILYLCCATKYVSEFAIADLKDQKFRDVWLGSRMTFYEKLNPSAVCPPCWMEGKNDLLEYLVKQGDDQVYFP